MTLVLLLIGWVVGSVMTLTILSLMAVYKNLVEQREKLKEAEKRSQAVTAASEAYAGLRFAEALRKQQSHIAEAIRNDKAKWVQ